MIVFFHLKTCKKVVSKHWSQAVLNEVREVFIKVSLWSLFGGIRPKDDSSRLNNPKHSKLRVKFIITFREVKLMI